MVAQHLLFPGVGARSDRLRLHHTHSPHTHGCAGARGRVPGGAAGKHLRSTEPGRDFLRTRRLGWVPSGSGRSGKVVWGCRCLAAGAGGALPHRGRAAQQPPPHVPRREARRPGRVSRSAFFRGSDSSFGGGKASPDSFGSRRRQNEPRLNIFFLEWIFPSNSQTPFLISPRESLDTAILSWWSEPRIQKGSRPLLKACRPC